MISMIKTAFTVLLGLALIWANHLQAKDLLILTDEAPPHMIKEDDSGIDLDIATQILSQLGYRSNVFYTPLSRAKMSVEKNLADVMVPTFFQQDSENFYLSDPIVYYRPTIFSLTDKKIDTSDISKLEGLRLMTFQGAKGYFHKEFEELVERSKYREMHDMSVLPELLLKDRADIVVLDYYIFFYFALDRVDNFNPDMFSFSPLIDKVPAYAGFHSKELRDKFNKELKNFMAEGKDKQVIRKYLGDNIPIDLVAR